MCFLHVADSVSVSVLPYHLFEIFPLIVLSIEILILCEKLIAMIISSRAPSWCSQRAQRVGKQKPTRAPSIIEYFQIPGATMADQERDRVSMQKAGLQTADNL